jgi:hypothetical protein
MCSTLFREFWMDIVSAAGGQVERIRPAPREAMSPIAKSQRLPTDHVQHSRTTRT